MSINQPELYQAYWQLGELKDQIRPQTPVYEMSIGYFHTILDRLTAISPQFHHFRIQPDELHSMRGATYCPDELFRKKIDETTKFIRTLLANAPPT